MPCIEELQEHLQAYAISRSTTSESGLGVMSGLFRAICCAEEYGAAALSGTRYCGAATDAKERLQGYPERDRGVFA